MNTSSVRCSGLFEAQTLAAGVYASDTDFAAGQPVAPALLARLTSSRPWFARRPTEHVDVVKKLWDSFEDDAFIRNRETGQFFDRAKVHYTDHNGAHFKVKGPLNVSRSPQGHPVIVPAGQSEDGGGLAAKTPR
ncbi:MAG: hypothetical protein ACD_54C00802G0001 [uncultured bacterium]|nr:MAG: hypothetical protein ACD_54C00802G0001 [uncultured bacterium]